MSYAEALAELETILQELQQTPTDIDRLHARVARAEQLIASCRATLRSVEDELGKLGQTTDAAVDQ
ncbi:exodeoxyribonuclease VII small subunit [Lewinella sp. IMCC34191]|uniref:exodeoxyribonuclease VII small subunit n=1 Tax=Lewinella sp. IMCC34191 TaxID=2259172 RepID=UPI001300BC06|nr:exodeoxyribonuclease VII small subunit [Lewinella sp. IMCC34191]